MRLVTRLALGLLFLLAAGAPSYAGARLDTIEARGHLSCGVGAQVPGFSRPDASGRMQGFDADICRAIAAAIFGDAEKIQFKPIDTLVTFLNSPDIDVVLRGLTWTFAREVRGSLRFGPIVMYDGESFLVPKTLPARSIAELSGKPICVSADAEFGPTLERYFRLHHLVLKAVVSEKRAQAAAAFFAGRCDAMTADASELAEAVIGLAPRSDAYTILPLTITKEPLAPLLRKGDDQFLDVVRWAVFALIDAEELGIDSTNVDALRNSDDPVVQKFFAPPPEGAAGFAHDWSYAIVKEVGNYGQIYERHLGAGSPAKLARGLNRPWNAGGILYAPPVR
jgi:general L-amino acid transport system substrate-binding protein